MQLVLDSLTHSWYVVAGIPRKTIPLDPLATAFDPDDPLAPFKIAEGSLEDLLVKDEFLALQEKIRAAFAVLIREKEIIMKVIDTEYLRYLKSTAQDAGANPELMNAITADDNAMRFLRANDNALGSIARDNNAMGTIVTHDAAIESIASNAGAVRAIASKPDAIDTIASDADAVRAIAKKENALRTLAEDEETMQKLFEMWKKARQS